MSREKQLALAILAGGAMLPALPVQVEAQAPTFRTLYRFSGGADGGRPLAGLLYQGGLLYGTTQRGGAAGLGTVFAVDPLTGAQSVIYSFALGGDAAQPQAGLVALGGLLYGTAPQGGAYGAGAVFSVDPVSGVEHVLYSFTGGVDGRYPYGELISAGAILYGTTQGGGNYYAGTVFQLDPATAGEAVVYSFTGGADGADPYAGLTSHNGLLYGTAGDGGKAGYGTVFQLDPATGRQTVLHAFSGGADGGHPMTGLLFQSGVLYGTTNNGGYPAAGTVFRIDPTTGAETVLYAFADAADGGYPAGGLAWFNGALYGTTTLGGASGAGTVFSVDPVSGAENVLYDFTGNAHGGYPAGDLLALGPALYGTNPSGPARGTVFKIRP